MYANIMIMLTTAILRTMFAFIVMSWLGITSLHCFWTPATQLTYWLVNVQCGNHETQLWKLFEYSFIVLISVTRKSASVR